MTGRLLERRARRRYIRLASGCVLSEVGVAGGVRKGCVCEVVVVVGGCGCG